MGEEYPLCEACKGFDYSPFGQSSDSSPHLGTAADILERIGDCVFCRFLYTNFLSGSPPFFGQESPYPDAVKVFVRRECMGWIPSSEDSKDTHTAVHMVSVSATKSSVASANLVPCLIPIPSVRGYWSSPSIYLEYGARSFSSRLIESKVSIQLPQKWLSLCREVHGDSCENPSWIRPDEHPIDMRLIDVQKMCVVKAQPECRYICLSYVWGTSSLQPKTQAMQKTIYDLELPFGLERIDLPRTISDAIRFTQDMGELYLWVDCLCIVQDDEREKKLQINQMDLVYARSLLTIAVVAGEDCNAGIPHLYREIRKPQQDFVQLSSDRGLMTSEHDGWYKKDERWATRGWTYQELHLSRRVLMVFKEMLHWRCKCNYWNERECLEPSQSVSKACINKLPMSLGISFVRSRFDTDSLNIHTAHFNEDREFKCDGDALDAFRGILKRMEQVSGTRFHWALPRRYFHGSLLWGNRPRKGRRANRPRKGLCVLVSRNGDIYTTQLPSWSWIGWYTQLNGAVYDAEGAQKSIDESASYNTDWAAEWFCINTAGKLSKLEQSPWHERQRYRMLEKIHRPVWVGNSQETDSMVTTAAGNDTGRITAWTSYARCRIRARSFDDRTRRKGGEPRDGFEYDVLSSGEQIIGRLYSVDLVSPAEEYDKVRIAEERDNGRLRDLIVISRQKGWSPYAHVKDHVRAMPIPVLNLMMIQVAPDGSEVASRLGVFQVPEKFWINCSPEWRRMTLQ
ncbi:hypothetical protein JMJ35_006942 [Cladonia borealis]|uniref:Heterokaryon incompatibility domain-containing protein n=1 Tax=Cladonia borealis TaxID=184061 RepID=A0AA39V7L5_9LECA|nr:hypothetical protein JMJ35_006942 [Cladonia borealis]